MATPRQVIEAASSHLDESLGMRQNARAVRLAPAPHAKDVGRVPNRRLGTLRADQIIPDPDQPRNEFTEDALERLAQSIRERGQLTPIRVRWSDDRQKWIIISGERRWRAACRAGLKHVDCFFVDSPLATSEILEEQLIENCLREDLKPTEEARAFAKIMEMNAWTGKQLADALRITPTHVSRRLALRRLPEDVQAQVDAGAVSARSAYELAKLQAPEIQQDLATKIAAGELSVTQTENAVRQRKGKPKQTSRGVCQTFLSDGGRKVTVTGPPGTTYHQIEAALTQALEEVRHRINCGRTLF